MCEILLGWQLSQQSSHVSTLTKTTTADLAQPPSCMHACERELPVHTYLSTYPRVAIGFVNSSDQSLWTFFSSLTLALLTTYQAINFVLTFYQLIRALVDKRRIEVMKSDEAHMVRGMGWISLGIKLGAIESVIGFAPSSFGSAFTRRILRFIGRACLIIGVVKG